MMLNNTSIPHEPTKEDYRIISLIGIWFILQLFFNDIGNFFTIKAGINLRPDRIFYIYIIFYSFRFFVAQKRRLKPTFLEFFYFVFFILTLFSCIVSGSINHPANRHISTIMNFIFIPLSIFYIVRRLAINDTIIRKLFIFFAVIATYLSLTAFFEHYSISRLVIPSYIMDPNTGIHWGRARGPFVQAAVLGSVLCITFLTTLALLIFEKRKVYYGILLFMILISIYFTYTKSNWVMLAVSGMTLGIFAKWFRKYFISFVLVITILFFSGVLSKFSAERSLFKERQKTVWDRYNIMYAAWLMFLDKPLFGFGYGTFEDYNDNYFVGLSGIEVRGDGEGNHNMLLGLLAEVGIAGTLPFLIFSMGLFYISYTSQKIQRHNSLLGYHAIVPSICFSALAGFYVAAQLFDPRFFALLNSMVLILCAISSPIYPFLVTNSLPEKNQFIQDCFLDDQSLT